MYLLIFVLVPVPSFFSDIVLMFTVKKKANVQGDFEATLTEDEIITIYTNEIL